MRAGRRIEDENTVITTLNGHSSLLISNITADQSGKYTVEIMNSHSNDVISASVAVEGPPEPPGGIPSISTGPDRVAIAWCGPPYDGGCMVTGFILEKQENDKEWTIVTHVADSLAFTVKNLKQGIKYRFRVRAQNIHGCSEPSVPSEEVVLLDKPKLETHTNSSDIIIPSGGDFRSQFEVLEELGKGRFGVVHKVIEKRTGLVLAAKVIKCIKAKDREKVKEEIDIMKSLSHPKILQLAASFETPKEAIMVTEYITGGELFERVVADDFTLTERDCILFMRQICEGVDYMHSKLIVHLDLKPENIMCRTRTSHELKIIDFGLAQQLSIDKPVRVLFGTPEFIPPEIINYEPIGTKSDMWSVGVICYVLLSGLSPFMGENDVDTFSNITRADYDFDDDAFDAVSEEAKDFISELLVHRKEDRLTAKQCLESDWLSQDHDNLSFNKICTDKLKKFIIRRKWQKTGNAIRALGRMATLTASRRNSASPNAVNNSNNSPRPLVTVSQSNPPANLTVSSEINEINGVDSVSKGKDKACCERSDSGFSECSASSNVSNSCQCAVNLLKKNGSIIEENSNDVLDAQIDQETPTESGTGSMKSLEMTPEDQMVRQQSVEKEITKKYDLENTIAIRKKSLENQFSKNLLKNNELSLPKRLESGKVSQLKEKFVQTTNGGSKTNNCMDLTDSVPTKKVSKLTINSNNSKSRLDHPIGDNSPPLRLSGRVKNVTERLTSSPSSPLPTKKSPQTHIKSGISPNLAARNDNFKKAAEFWNR